MAEVHPLSPRRRQQYPRERDGSPWQCGSYHTVGTGPLSCAKRKGFYSYRPSLLYLSSSFHYDLFWLVLSIELLEQSNHHLIACCVCIWHTGHVCIVLTYSTNWWGCEPMLFRGIPVILQFMGGSMLQQKHCHYLELLHCYLSCFGHIT